MDLTIINFNQEQYFTPNLSLCHTAVSHPLITAQYGNYSVFNNFDRHNLELFPFATFHHVWYDQNTPLCRFTCKRQQKGYEWLLHLRGSLNLHSLLQEELRGKAIAFRALVLMWQGVWKTNSGYLEKLQNRDLLLVQFYFTCLWGSHKAETGDKNNLFYCHDTVWIPFCLLKYFDKLVKHRLIQ